MKKLGKILGSLLLVLTVLTGAAMNSAFAAVATPTKKAILVVSFGTTYGDTRKATIDAVADKVRNTFPDYEVRSAFTSRIIIKRIADRDGIKIDTEKQALDRLKQEGYTDVIVQPLHIEAGDEYDKVAKVVAMSRHNKDFKQISLGRPLLFYTGQEERPDDYKMLIQALKNQLPSTNSQEAVVLMGHGGVHPANAAYGVLQLKLMDEGMNRVWVSTVEGYPTLEDVIQKAKTNKIKKITLIPLMVVAGDHAQNDMAGDEPDSYKSQLIKAGFKVETYLHGLGENKMIQDLYVEHIRDSIEGKNSRDERGKDRPEIPVIE